MVSAEEQQQEASPAVRSVHSVLADFPLDVVASFPVMVAAPLCAQSAYMPNLQSLPEDLSALCSLSAHVPDFLAPPPEGWTPLSNLAASAPVPDPESEVPSTESSLLCDSMYARLRSHLASKAQPSNPGWWDDSGLADFDECGDFPAGGVVLTSVQRALRLKASQQVELQAQVGNPSAS